MKHYILKGKEVHIEESLMAWGKWFETADRKVALTMIDEIRVSTVFLGLDHNFSSSGDPLLFETMVFLPEEHDGRMARYFTWGEAEVGHAEIVRIVQNEINQSHLVTIDALTSIMQASKHV